MNVRRVSLQTWLGAAALAVGLVASLAVLLVVLPTLESSLRDRRAVQVRAEVLPHLAAAREALVRARDQREFELVVRELAGNLGGHVRADFGSYSAQSDRRDFYAARRAAMVERLNPINPQVEVATIAGDEPNSRVVLGATLLSHPLRIAQGSLDVGIRVRDGGGQLSEIRRRLIIAIGLVLVLASLFGLLLARLLGSRIRRLATTASKLASGDLAARAPSQAPAEVRTLGESLNVMASRIQNLVGEITHDRDRAQGLVASLAEGVLVVGPDGDVTVANAAAHRTLALRPHAGVAPDEPLPDEIVELVESVAARGPRAVASLETAVAGRELEVHASALADVAAGVVVTLRDVTEERRLARARRDLVANVSHELKTPLSAIKGFQELLENPRLDSERRERFLDLMSGEINRLERLVVDQLELARLDAGEFPLEREEVDLGELVVGVTEPRRVLAEKEGIVLAVHRPREGTVVIDADPARIEQIMLILLDNALRHTPSGGRVRVSVALRGDGAAIAIADDGEGIPDDIQPFVFDRFYQGDSSRAGRSAGLGLAIARGLAEAHGGRIELSSMVGVGSTFTVVIPGARAAEPIGEVGLADDRPA